MQTYKFTSELTYLVIFSLVIFLVVLKEHRQMTILRGGGEEGRRGFKWDRSDCNILLLYSYEHMSVSNTAGCDTGKCYKW